MTMGAMDDEMTTWRALILAEMEEQHESWADVIACTLTDAELDVAFDESYGTTEGKPFTLWTKRRVYFPGEYDGSEWCASVPRDPCDEVTRHVGGG